MERIQINSSDDYYLIAPNDAKKYTIIDLYINRKPVSCVPRINFKLCIKEDGKYVDKGEFNHRLNYKNIEDYTLDEIISIHKLGKFTLFRYTGWHKLEKPINVKNKCLIKLEHGGNNHKDSIYCDILDYYWCLCEDVYGYYRSHWLMYDDKAFSINGIDLYINGKYILEYTSSELSDIIDSKNYVIGPNSTLPDKVFQEVVNPQEFTLDDYYCSMFDGELVINTSSIKTYPCKNGVLDLVINHHKPKKIVIHNGIKNIIKVIEVLLEYKLPILIH